MKTSIGFIGGGRITRIILQGFRNNSILFDTVKVYEPNAETLGVLAADFPDIEMAETAELAAIQQLVFIAVHPPVVMETLQKIKNSVSESTIVISLAPKITIEKMATVLHTKKLVRMIPNATSYINEGFNPVSFQPEMEKKEKRPILKLLKNLGKTFETEEYKLEGYAIASAMLPTYFWFQWYEIERIARETGLTAKEARKAVKSTLKKALKLYYNSDLTTHEVMDLIPVKPIGEYETDITEIFDVKLMELFAKIKQ
jgi:pyrroline-5-carboxylate reductase